MHEEHFPCDLDIQQRGINQRIASSGRDEELSPTNWKSGPRFPDPEPEFLATNFFEPLNFAARGDNYQRVTMPKSPGKTIGTPLNIPRVQRFTSIPIVNIAPKPNTTSGMTSSIRPASKPATVASAAMSSTTQSVLSPGSTAVQSNLSSLSHANIKSMMARQTGVMSTNPATSLRHLAPPQHANVVTSNVSIMSSVITPQGIMTSIPMIQQPTTTQLCSFAQQANFAHPGTQQGAFITPQGARTPFVNSLPATFLAIPQLQTNSSQLPRFHLIRAPPPTIIRNSIPLIFNHANPSILPGQSAFQTPIRIPMPGTPPKLRHSHEILPKSPILRPQFMNAPVVLSGPITSSQPLTIAAQFSPVQTTQPPHLSPQGLRSPQTSPGQPPNLSPHTSPNPKHSHVITNTPQPPKLSPHLSPSINMSSHMRPIVSQPSFSPKANAAIEPTDSLPINLDLKQRKTSDKNDVVKSLKLELQEPLKDADDGELDFVWEEYLEDTGALAAPPTAFRHVECSLHNGFSKGMKLEVANKLKSETFWVASVVMTCGPLLRLRYDGYGDDSSGDFWCDVSTADLHAIGWCAKNGKRLQPPESIKNKHDNWKEFLVCTLTGAITAPSYLLDKETGVTPIDQIKRGMRVELQDQVNPSCVWMAKVLENVGGRLLMRYEGIDSAQHDFWLFYLHHRIHPMGWAVDNNCQFKPPDHLKDEHVNYSEWAEILQNATRESENFKPPMDIFKDQEEIVSHRFLEGMKLEALSPSSRNHLCPGTVIEVVNQFYFVVEIDDLLNQRGIDVRPTLRFFCHKNCRVLFPVNWASKRGLRVNAPRGWPRRDFDWDEYLDTENATAAPLDCFNLSAPVHDLQVGMKLEAVNPSLPHQICAATITRILDRMVWIHLDNARKLQANHVVDVESHEIFPVGWCASNHYPLKPPIQSKSAKKTTVVQRERPVLETPEEYRSAAYSMMREGNGDMCPKIYFNHRCFSGRYLNKGRIAALPKSVGPGPVILVMKEVLTMLVNTAYKSSRVLSELQIQGETNPTMHQQVLKAKYKGKSYRAMVEICKTAEEIDDFCRQTCIRLECCPNLISTSLVDHECPADCANLTKTTYNFGGKKMKRKPGRPPGGHSNLENGAKRPGRKRKVGRNRLMNLLRPKPANDSDLDNNGLLGNDSQDNINFLDDGNQDDNKSTGTTASRDSLDSVRMARKRKYQKAAPPPPSEIQTRGVKLPKYSFVRKSHQKVMLSGSDIPAPMSNADESDIKSADRVDHDPLKLETNPLHWTVDDVVMFIKTTDCSSMARLFREHDIDGQAFLLLTLPAVQEHMDMKFGPAIKLCHHIERVKVAFFLQFAN